MTFQLGAALLDACVLAALAQGDAYGYVLTQRVKQTMDISESTLYPVLRRLQRDGCLATYDQPFQGRNRRYYHLTEDGARRLAETRSEWDGYKKRVDEMLSGGKADGKKTVSL